MAVAPASGETVVVSAAAGGVGSIAVQLAPDAGARVIGLAGEPHVEVPIAHVYPLQRVRDAYSELEHRHTLGKIILMP
jgi:NADPH-dependent curcumin reductase CurA